MLTEGRRDGNFLGNGGMVIYGNRRVPVVAQPGVWPFTEVSIGWHFNQVTPPQ